MMTTTEEPGNDTGIPADVKTAKLRIVTEAPLQIDIDCTNDSKAVRLITAAIQSGAFKELVRKGNRLCLLGGNPQTGPLSVEPCSPDGLKSLLNDPPFHCFKKVNGKDGVPIVFDELPKTDVCRAVLARRDWSELIPEYRPDHGRWVLRCPNGTVELLANKLRESTREDQHTHQTNVRFDPEAGVDCPMFVAQVAKVAPHDCCRESLLDSIAYCLTGATTEQKFFWLQGATGSGKSTVWKILVQLLGGYAVTAHPKIFFGRGDEHTTEIINLEGRRVIFQDEIPKDERTRKPLPLRTDVINRMTSNDELTARRAHKDNEGEVRISWKIVTSSNEKPEKQGMAGDGIYRRMMLWFVKEAYLSEDPEVAKKKGLTPVRRGYEHRVVAAEGTQILNFLIQRLPRIRKSGIPVCEHIRGEVAWYADTSDPTNDFFRRMIVDDPKASVCGDDLREAWKKLTGQILSSHSPKIATMMHERGYGKTEPGKRWSRGDDTKVQRGYSGLRIRDGVLDKGPWVMRP